MFWLVTQKILGNKTEILACAEYRIFGISGAKYPAPPYTICKYLTHLQRTKLPHVYQEIKGGLARTRRLNSSCCFLDFLVTKIIIVQASLSSPLCTYIADQKTDMKLFSSHSWG